jgi:hypothetical protein
VFPLTGVGVDPQHLVLTIESRKLLPPDLVSRFVITFDEREFISKTLEIFQGTNVIANVAANLVANVAANLVANVSVAEIDGGSVLAHFPSGSGAVILIGNVIANLFGKAGY